MKSKFGKVIAPILILSLVAAFLIVCTLNNVTAVPISGTVSEKLGAYTGPVGGAQQDDNVKASLDLAHTDLDTGLANQEDLDALNRKGTGNIFYVDSAQSGTAGTSRAEAVNDLEEVQALLAADNNDHVYIAAGHAETLGGAKAIDLDIAGVTYHFEGNGKNRALFSYDTNVDSIAIGADDITLDGIDCIATVTAVANAIIVEAGVKNFIIENGSFINETAGTDEFIDTILISGTASDGGIIRGNLFVSDTLENAGPKSSINFVDCDNIQVYDNQFFGDAGDAHIFNETTASNFVSIHDNEIHQGAIGDAKLDTTPGISLVATTTGMIYKNEIATNTGDKTLAIVAADCHVFDNSYSEIQGSTLDIGKTYAITGSTTVAASPDTLFTVAGGRILITGLFAELAANLSGSPGTLQLSNNATAGAAWDRTFTTAVNVDAYAQGDLLRFTNAIDEGVIDLTANKGAGQTLSWMASPGLIEQLLGSTGAGGPIAWYMTFIPLEEGVTVLVGP